MWKVTRTSHSIFLGVNVERARQPIFIFLFWFWFHGMNYSSLVNAGFIHFKPPASKSIGKILSLLARTAKVLPPG